MNIRRITIVCLLSAFTVVSAFAQNKAMNEMWGETAVQISKWTEGSSAGWILDVFQSGYYYIDLIYKGKGKLVWNISTDEGVVVQNQQAATEKYRDYPMGILEFKKPGRHTLNVSLVEGDPETSSFESVYIHPIN